MAGQEMKGEGTKGQGVGDRQMPGGQVETMRKRAGREVSVRGGDRMMLGEERGRALGARGEKGRCWEKA